MEPLVKPNSKPHGEASTPTFSKAQVETTEPAADIPVLTTQVNEKYDECINENSQSNEPETKDKINFEVEDDDDQAIANLLEKMSKGTQVKAKELMVIDDNSNTKEEPIVKL